MSNFLQSPSSTGVFRSADAQVDNASVNNGDGPMPPRPPRPPPQAESPPPPGPPLALSYPTIDDAVSAMASRFHIGTIQEIMAMGEFDFLKVKRSSAVGPTPRDLCIMHQHRTCRDHSVASALILIKPKASSPCTLNARSIK